MVAGATGIDLFLLVVDAGEGARAADTRAPGDHQAARDRARRRRAHEGGRGRRGDPRAGGRGGARARPGGGGRGDERAHRRGARRAARCARRGGRPRRAAAIDRPTRLFVDRVFTLKGIGTVVTGTLWSGSVGEGDELRAEPAGLGRARPQRPGARPAGRACRGRPAGRGRAPRRRAERPAARRRARRARAHTRSATGSTSLLEPLDEIGDGTRLHVHHGTAEHFARVVRVGERYAQLRLSSPVVAARGDRVVLRERTTLGGGIVLDPAPPRQTVRGAAGPARAGRSRLHRHGRALRRERADAPRGARAPRPASRGGARRRARRGRARRRLVPDSRAARGAALRRRARARRARGRLPLDPGVPVAELLPQRPWAAALLPLLPIERRGAKAYAPGATRGPGRPSRVRGGDRGRARRGGLHAREGRGSRAGALPGGGRPPRPAWRRPRSRRRRPRGGPPTAGRGVRAPRARSRSPASATSSAPAASRPSSSSSASTPTGSHAASATSGSSGARRKPARFSAERPGPGGPAGLQNR